MTAAQSPSAMQVAAAMMPRIDPDAPTSSASAGTSPMPSAAVSRNAAPPTTPQTA